MRVHTYKIPGITKIGWIHSFLLPRRIDLRAIVGQKVVLFVKPTEIEFSKSPELSVTRKKEGGAYSESSELSFVTPTELPKLSDIAFVIEGADKEKYIIGSRELPKANIEIARTPGAPEGSPNAYTVKVTHTGLRSLIPCKI